MKIKDLIKFKMYKEMKYNNKDKQYNIYKEKYKE